MVVILRAWKFSTSKVRKGCGNSGSSNAVFGPSISPTTAITVGPVVVSSGSGGSNSYLHVQGSSSAVWTVNHLLGRRPSVTVRSVGGLDVVTPEIAHPSLTMLTITFDVPFAGEAYCI